MQGLKARINKLFRSWAFIQIFIITLIITVGLILDLVIIFTGIEPIIRVDDGYLQSLFAMVFTVGTLSSSILAIIISALNSGNYGFTVKQYESFKCSPLKMKHILVVSAVLILISIAENSLLLYNSITLTGIALLAYYIFNSWIIFRMVSEREYAKELINKELKSEGIKTEYVYNWMNGLKSALAMKNTKEIETCTEFLKRTMESGNEDAKSLIQNEISEAFAVSNNNYSFMDSFSKVLRLNDSSELFDEYDIILTYCKKLRYESITGLRSFNVSGTVDAIISSDVLTYDKKVDFVLYILYNYFDNSIISLDDKLDLINPVFERIVCFDRNDSVNSVKERIILLFYKEQILKNSNYIEAKKIFDRLSDYLFLRERVSNNEYLADTVAKIIRALYFWCYFETETLSQVHRDNLQKLISKKVQTIDNAAICISNVNRKFANQMVQQLIKDAVNHKYMDTFDYFSRYQNGKNIFWDSNNKIRFAFWLFLLYFSFNFSFSILDYCNKDDENYLLDARGLYLNVRDEFDIDTKLLTTRAKKNLEQLGDLLGLRVAVSDSLQKRMYKGINEEILKINQSIETRSGCEDNEIVKYLAEMCSQGSDSNSLVWDHSIPLSEKAEYIFVERVCLSNYKNPEKTVARSIYHFLTYIVNEMVIRVLPKVTLTFDLKGVKKLLEKIRSLDKLSFRNYTFIDDWGLNEDVRKSSEYKELSELIKGTDKRFVQGISAECFLNIEKICFNYTVWSITKEQLTDGEVNEILSNNKLNDNEYNINGSVCDKTEAEKLVREEYQKIIATLSISTNVNSDSGFQVKF